MVACIIGAGNEWGKLNKRIRSALSLKILYNTTYSLMSAYADGMIHIIQNILTRFRQSKVNCDKKKKKSQTKSNERHCINIATTRGILD